MGFSLKKVFADYKLGSVLLIVVLAYSLYVLFNYLNNNGRIGSESLVNDEDEDEDDGDEAAPFSSAPDNVRPITASEQSDLFNSTDGGGSVSMGKYGANPPTGSNNLNSAPEDLLPSDTNGSGANEWAQLNPDGKGELTNINTLPAGYYIGLETAVQTNKNPNLQVRSEPANPRINVSVWNQSTITPDETRRQFEIGGDSSA